MGAAGSWSHLMERALDQGRIDRRWRVAFWLAIGAILSTIAIWHWAWDITVIDYGESSKTFFDKTQVSPGEKVGLWFADARWTNVCKSELHARVTCQMLDPQNSTKTISGRLDLEPHSIDAPKTPGRVPLKRRDFIVPEQCLPGPLVWSAQATSYCFPFGELNPRIAEPPELHLTVK